MKAFFLTLLLALAACVPPSLADPQPLHPTDVRGALGVNIHFTEPRAGEMPMLAGTGLGWVRRDLPWSGTETQKGVYDFRRYDALLDQLQRADMRALFILDYGNPLYTGGLPPGDDAGRAAFVRWAVAAVTHFKGRGVVWEMYNEPNNKEFWKPQPDAADYAKLALAVGKALHDAAPLETLIGPGCATIDDRFLEQCFQAGTLQYWSAVSVHPYRKSAPETVGPEYRKLRALIAQYAPPGKTIPIISSEWGYPTVWVPVTTQTDYLVREFLFNIADGVPLSIWYDWRHGGQPENRRDIFGMVVPDYHANQTPVFPPQPIYTASATLSRLLGDFRFAGRLPADDAAQDYVLSFAHGRDHRFAAWTTAASPRPVTLAVPPGRYRVSDDLGISQGTVTAGSDGLPFTLTSSPQYLVRAK